MTTNTKLQSSCIYSNKDKNFKANHNRLGNVFFKPSVVSIVTKIRILKQITTVTSRGRPLLSCIYSNKDKNFKANHNNPYMMQPDSGVVSIVTKIRILKQITTNNSKEIHFECCIYSNKDKNFKANHNNPYMMMNNGNVVSIVTKIRILKQITTSRSLNTAKRKLRL